MLVAGVFVCDPSSVVAAIDVSNIANDLRTGDCAKPLSRSQRLVFNQKLAAAAQHASKGVELRQSLKRAGYRADESFVVQLGGTLTVDGLKRTLSKNYCEALTNARLTQIGFAQTDRSLTIIVARPFTPPVPSESGKISRQILDLVNSARAKGGRCGSERFAPARALTLDERLQQAALAHAKDMAKRDAISHRGSDGSAPADRVSRTGYAWRVVGENVASGQTTADEVVQGWLKSPEHCKNILDGDFTQMAAAYVVDAGTDGGIFWAQVFGRPR